MISLKDVESVPYPMIDLDSAPYPTEEDVESNLYPTKDPESPESKWNHCLQFTCIWHDYAACDTMAPTVYNDPDNPPCCVHILRDMAAAFDAVMRTLGFEYYANYGMLLGLMRSDKLIPWTFDNDYVVSNRTLSAMMNLSPEAKGVFDSHGLSFFFDNIYHRVCITPAFKGGALAKLWTTTSYQWYPLAYPYADIFVADEKGADMVDELGCTHPITEFSPAVRRWVYQDSFEVSIPANAEGILERIYGKEWRVPDANKSPHGDTKCAVSEGRPLVTSSLTMLVLLGMTVCAGALFIFL
ncbi:hypothetical protein ACHAWF_001830 [Thalassiosira exigua]